MIPEKIIISQYLIIFQFLILAEGVVYLFFEKVAINNYSFNNWFCCHHYRLRVMHEPIKILSEDQLLTIIVSRNS